MAKKKAEEDEIEQEEEAPPPPLRNPSARKKPRTGGASTAAPGMCDDVLRSIFSRAPARTAVASMALSKHHRRLMRCPDFIALHCRLAPPLPLPHVAYVVTATVRRSGGARGPVSGYHGFHVAGGEEGLGGSGSGNAPMRALAGPTYLEKRCVNTCNGVVLLAGGRPRPTTCVLWNPAVADEAKEVTVPVSARDDCAILGLGYGPRTKTYKLLLTRRQKMKGALDCYPPITRLPKELLVYTLGGAGQEPRLRTLLSKGLGGFSGQSLYTDGSIYLLHVGNKPAILAFDVDEETVTTVDLPGEHSSRQHLMTSPLLVMSGRPCVDIKDSHGRALWLLTAEHRWERRFVIEGHQERPFVMQEIRSRSSSHDRYLVAGVWNCGSALAVFLRLASSSRKDGEDDKLLLHCSETNQLEVLNLPRSMTPEWSDYSFCWGYKPTLISPGSIVGELSQDEDKRRDSNSDIMAALEPVNERHRRKGQKATLDTVCFMEFLLRTMRRLEAA